MSFKTKTLFLILIALLNQNMRSQPGIKGEIIIDTSVWTPVAYLSLIPDFDELYTMNYEMIIDTANIDDKGRFRFNTAYLPDGDNLFRIHITKKDSPPASLIIGGNDENHFFLVAGNRSQIEVVDTNRSELFKDITFEGYYPNRSLREIDEIANYLDTTDFNGSRVKTELVRNAIFGKLRYYADTCSNPVVALYALYKSKFEKDWPVNQLFYKNFLAKWKREDSTYFTEFRKKIPKTGNTGAGLIIVIAVTFLLIGILSYRLYLKVSGKNRNLLHDLSVRERKILNMIIDGKSNKEISENLNIGISTVKSHVNSIYSKLDIRSRKDVLNLNIDNRDNRQVVIKS